MKVLIFSDIHGNLPALEAVINKEQGIDKYIFLGDVVNYGPWDNDCVDLLNSLKSCVKLIGNHEEYYINGSIDKPNSLVKQFFEVCYPKFDRFNEINSFLKSYEFGGFKCQHTINNRNIYPDTKLELDCNYFIGHSHYQFKTTSENHIVYNPGSVGQNRRYINVINYIVFKLETMEIQMKALVYNYKTVINEMKANNYPKVCIDYYLGKSII
jgi:predicted phosphodiesterase